MVYRACRTLKHNDRTWRSGEEVPADAFAPELLRCLLDVGHLRIDRGEARPPVAVKARSVPAASKKGGRKARKEQA